MPVVSLQSHHFEEETLYTIIGMVSPFFPAGMGTTFEQAENHAQLQYTRNTHEKVSGPSELLGFHTTETLVVALRAS